MLNSIPDDIRDINVTMGYPMKGSDLCVLMGALSCAQMNALVREHKTYFYHRYVRSVLSNSIFRKIATEEDNAVCSAVLNGRRSYIEVADFAGSGQSSGGFGRDCPLVCGLPEDRTEPRGRPSCGKRTFGT